MEYYKESLIEFKNWVEHGYAHNTYMPSSFAINTAVEAMEKQIPKRAEYHEPDFDVRMFGWWSCGECGSEIASEAHNYCGCCGQRLEMWSSGA